MMPTAREVELRAVRTSQLNRLFLEHKRELLRQFREGTFPIRVTMDIRSDPDYWRPLAEARAAEEAAEAK